MAHASVRPDSVSVLAERRRNTACRAVARTLPSNWLVSTVLNAKLPQYLGRISYSLYIVHGPMIHTLGYAVFPLFWSTRAGKTRGDMPWASRPHTLFLLRLSCGWRICSGEQSTSPVFVWGRGLRGLCVCRNCDFLGWLLLGIYDILMINIKPNTFLHE